MIRGHGSTVAIIAAFLNVTPARVRQIIAEHHIEPTGSDWKAKLYDPTDIFRHTDVRDRRSPLN